MQRGSMQKGNKSYWQQKYWSRNAELEKEFRARSLTNKLNKVHNVNFWIYWRFIDRAGKVDQVGWQIFICFNKNGGHSCISFKAVQKFCGNSQRIIDTRMGQAYNYIFKGKGPSKLYPIKACHEAHWLDVMISCTSHIVWKYYLRFSGRECMLWRSKVAEKPTQSFDIEPISLLPNSLTFNWQTISDLDTDHWLKDPVFYRLIC